MTWEINDPTGTNVLNSSDDLGTYLLDIIDVDPSGRVDASYTVPTSLQGSTISYDYSSVATRIWPVVVSKKVWNFGWRPVLENWTGPTDTTFSIAWRQIASSNVGDAGYQVYVFGAGATNVTGSHVSWLTDNGINEYLSADRAPMRYLSQQSVTTTALSGFFGAGVGSSVGVATPAQNGVAVLPELVMPVVRAGVNGGVTVQSNNFNNVSTEPWVMWGGLNASQTADIFWFTSRWPRTNNTGSPHMLLRDGSNRIFFDSRERYLRVLDIQVQNIVIPASGQVADGTVLANFSTTVPTDTSWGYLTNAGGLNPSPDAASSVRTSGRQLIQANAGSIPSPVISVAVDLTGL